jgi:mannan endo-1,4-beta-mannosidase
VQVTAGSTPINSWTVTWTFANGQTVSQFWSTALTPNGAAITARNLSYNGSLAAGARTEFGFTANLTGTANSVPAVTCTAG